jgi:hypothetical protein
MNYDSNRSTASIAVTQFLRLTRPDLDFKSEEWSQASWEGIPTMYWVEER